MLINLLIVFVSTVYSQNVMEFRDRNNVIRGSIDANGNLSTTGNFALQAGSTIAGNGTLTISTAATGAQSGIPSIFINQSGQVGISTTSPTSALEVGGTLKATNVTLTGTGNVLTMGSTNSGHINMANGNIVGINGLTINDSGIDEGISWGSSRRIPVYENSQGGFPGFVFDTAGGYSFIFQGGKVGLSTSAPTTTLDINGGLWASTGTFVATSTYSVISSSGIKIGGTSGLEAGYGFFLNTGNNAYSVYSSSGVMLSGTGGLVGPFVHAGTVTTTGPLMVSGPAVFKSSAVVGGNFGAAGATAADLSVTGAVFFGTAGSYKVTTLGVTTLANASVGDIKNDAANTVDFRILKTNMSTGKIVIGSGTTNGIIVMDNNGKTGIYTSVPQTQLDVNGNAQFGLNATKSTMTANGYFIPRTFTLAAIRAITPVAADVNGMVGCSNCTTTSVCIATGTTISGFCGMTGRTVECK